MQAHVRLVMTQPIQDFLRRLLYHLPCSLHLPPCSILMYCTAVAPVARLQLIHKLPQSRDYPESQGCQQYLMPSPGDLWLIINHE